MALGDGDTWDETLPTNATLATQIDDYNRDLRKGTRSRLALEHEWPASQSATAEAGKHKFITLQNQATQPSISGTQVSALYIKTDSGTAYGLYFAAISGNEKLIADTGGAFVRTGQSVQVIFNAMNTVASGSGTFVLNDAVPTTTAGFAVSALATTLTPLFATSMIHIEANVKVGKSINQNNAIFGCLYRATTGIAVGWDVAVDNGAPYNVLHCATYITAGNTTAAMPFSFRVGDTGGADTITINGSGGSRLFGGVAQSYLKIIEVIK